MKIFDITGDSYTHEVEEFKGTVLLDFFADWCAPCKSLAPVIEDVAKGAGDSIKVCKINVDSEKELAEKFGVRSIPTLVVMKNGSVMNRSIGVTGKKAILDMLE
ncbi:MAG: thioredoxin [Ruminococcaceae bacterium]|nr:thioredoxin [Oscillospiraceae bacterium]